MRMRIWQVTAFPESANPETWRQPAARRLRAGRNGTDPRFTEADVRESEARFRSMADSVPAAHLAFRNSTGGGPTSTRRGWSSPGTVAQELDFGWTENIHPEDRDRYLQTRTTPRSARTSRSRSNTDFVAATGTRWAPAGARRASPPSGQFAGFVGLCLDVTEQREANEAVRQSEAFPRSVFENSAPTASKKSSTSTGGCWK